MKDRLNRILSNLYFNAPITYIDLRDRLELTQSRTKSIDFRINKCYAVEFKLPYTNQIIIKQSKVKKAITFTLLT